LRGVEIGGEGKCHWKGNIHRERAGVVLITQKKGKKPSGQPNKKGTEGLDEDNRLLQTKDGSS